MKNFCKIFAAIFFSASILFTPPASAETKEITYDIINPQVMGYVATLPVSEKNYRSSKRPILIQGAMTAEVGELIVLKN